MFAKQEQVNEALRLQAAAQLNAFQAVSEHVFDAVGKLSALNLSAARATLEQSQETMKGLSEAKDVNAVLDTLGKVLGPVQAQATEYHQAASEILSSAGREIRKVAEAQVSTASETVSKFGAGLSEQGPFSAQQAVSAVQDAVEQVQGNVVALAEQAVGAAKAMQGGRAKRK